VLALVGTLAAGCTGTTPDAPSPSGSRTTGHATTTSPATAQTTGPPTAPAPPPVSPSPLRAPTAEEAACLGIGPRVVAVRRAIDRFMGAPHGVVPLSTVHQAGRALGRLVPVFRAHLRAHGPFRGGDACLGRAGAVLAKVGTALGPTAEIRLAALWYQLLVEFYPASPLLRTAEEYLFVQGYIVPSPGSGLQRG